MLPNKKAASSLADPTEYENLFPGFADTVKCEQFLKLQRMKRFPASNYPQVPVRFNAFLSYWSLSNKSTYCCKSVQTIFEPNTHVLNTSYFVPLRPIHIHFFGLLSMNSKKIHRIQVQVSTIQADGIQGKGYTLKSEVITLAD